MAEAVSGPTILDVAVPDRPDPRLLAVTRYRLLMEDAVRWGIAHPTYVTGAGSWIDRGAPAAFREARKVLDLEPEPDFAEGTRYAAWIGRRTWSEWLMPNPGRARELLQVGALLVLDGTEAVRRGAGLVRIFPGVPGRAAEVADRALWSTHNVVTCRRVQRYTAITFNNPYNLPSET